MADADEAAAVAAGAIGEDGDGPRMRRRRRSSGGGDGGGGDDGDGDGLSSTTTPPADAGREQHAGARGGGMVGLLASLVLSPLRLATGFNGDVDVDAATDAFLADYKRLGGAEDGGGGEGGGGDGGGGGGGGVVFSRSSYREALAEASRQEKLLLVYLHSPAHPDSGDFCQRVLGASDVATRTATSMVAWGGSLDFAEAYRLSGLLRACTFPYVAILEPPSDPTGSNAKLVDRMQGALEFDSLHTKLVRASDHFAGTIAQRVSQRWEANERQRLRDEQDEALRETMEADQRRDQERLDANRRRDQEQEGAERIAREEGQEAERVATEQREALEKMRADMVPEPQAGEGVTTIRFQLPEGGRFQRRFLSSATLAQLFDFAHVSLHERDSSICSFALVVNFPKKTFGPGEHLHATLQESGLAPQAVLFIQDLDV